MAVAGQILHNKLGVGFRYGMLGCMVAVKGIGGHLVDGRNKIAPADDHLVFAVPVEVTKAYFIDLRILVGKIADFLPYPVYLFNKQDVRRGGIPAGL